MKTQHDEEIMVFCFSDEEVPSPRAARQSGAPPAFTRAARAPRYAMQCARAHAIIFAFFALCLSFFHIDE